MRRLVLLLVLGLLLPSHAAAEASPDLRAQAIERVRAGLGDADRGVRCAAVEALAKTKEAPPEALASLLADPEWCVRREAAWWLRRGGEPALSQLAKVLSTGEWPARESATWALSTFGAAAVPLLRAALADPDEEVRLEALAAVRRLGKDVSAPLLPWVRPFAGPERTDEENEEAISALAVLDPTPEPPVVAKPPSGGGTSHRRTTPPAAGDDLPPDPALAPSKDLDAPFDRISTVLSLGRGPADADALGAALADPERDVRLAAVIALGRASGDATPRLVAALSDRNARVVRQAIVALGRRRAAAAEIAPFLADPALATSAAAREALVRMGADAAIPTVACLETGHYGALHQGRLVFEAIGAAGAPATARLAALLGHQDVNVREAAARCLFAIGPAARDAAPALAKALDDARLCVVANAALALGRVGLSEDAIAATQSPSARVRAYATFAIGWAFGELSGVDQAAYERRLPVLDLGAAGPFPTAEEVDRVADVEEGSPSNRAPRAALLRLAIRSKDPRVSIPAAALLAEGDVDPAEAERVMELLLPEGARTGSRVDFDRLRSLVGSSELIACITYAARARRTKPALGLVFGHLHRITRAENLPALGWFDRNEEVAVTGTDGELWMPDERSMRYALEQARRLIPAKTLSSIDDAARGWLEEFRADATWGLGSPAVWLLRDFTPRAEDAGLLLECARLSENTTEPDPARDEATRWALVRLLGFLPDAASLAYLGTLTATEDTTAQVAKAALARRGESTALQALLVASRDDPDALALLMEVAPLVANRALAERIVRGKYPGSAVGMGSDLLEVAHRVGGPLPPEAFLGLEPVLCEHVDDLSAAVEAATGLPGCATRRMLGRLFDAVDRDARSAEAASGEDGSFIGQEEFRAASALLVAAEPEAGREKLRRLATSPRASRRHAAADALLRAQDLASVTPVVAWLRETDRMYLDLDLVARFRRPEIGALLLAWSQEADLSESEETEILGALARFHGWPDPIYALGEEFASATAAREAIRRGDLDTLRALRKGGDPAAEEPVWMRIGRAALAGDRVARAALWSAFRAGRYRWVHYDFDPVVHTLGRDPSVLPHWAEDLDSNCCRISDGMGDGVFEDAYGLPYVYDRYREGVGRPVSEFVRDWMGLQAARFVWSPLLDRFIPEPE